MLQNPWKHSCKRVLKNLVPLPRTLSDGSLTEREQNRTEGIENGYGMGTEQVRNGYRMHEEWEQECVQNGNRTRSVKRSLLGFF